MQWHCREVKTLCVAKVQYLCSIPDFRFVDWSYLLSVAENRPNKLMSLKKSFDCGLQLHGCGLLNLEHLLKSFFSVPVLILNNMEQFKLTQIRSAQFLYTTLSCYSDSLH